MITVAWPIVVSMLSYTMMGFADTLMVGRLGTREVGAVGLGVVGAFTLTALGWGVMNAVKVVVAQAYGAGERDRARRAPYEGLVLALGFGLAALALMPTSSLIIGLLGGEGSVRTLGAEYFEIRLVGVLPMYVSIAAFGFFQGLGDTKTPMRVMVAANLLNVGLDYLLIFGVGPAPEMGVPGAAVATVVAFAVQGGLGVWLLLGATAATEPEGGWRDRVRMSGLRRLLELGMPMGFRNLLEVGSWSVFTGIVARTGEAHLAAHVIAIRIISVSFLPGHGISEAACVLTGQAVGAGNGDAARRVARTATNVCLVAMGACAVVFLFFGSELVGLFRNDPRVLETGARLLLIAAGFQLFDAVAMVKIGALNGAGDTRYVMFANVALAWLVLLPVGWGFCRAAGWGAPGAWVGITAEVAVLALVLSLRWRGPRPFEGALRQQAA